MYNGAVWGLHKADMNVFDFSGRRDIRRFVSLAKSVGLKILMYEMILTENLGKFGHFAMFWPYI